MEVSKTFNGLDFEPRARTHSRNRDKFKGGKSACFEIKGDSIMAIHAAKTRTQTQIHSAESVETENGFQPEMVVTTTIIEEGELQQESDVTQEPEAVDESVGEEEEEVKSSLTVYKYAIVGVAVAAVGYGVYTLLKD
jgi:hypothetical protein